MAVALRETSTKGVGGKAKHGPNPSDPEKLISLVCGKGMSDMADAREVMNIRQASQYLGVSTDTLYKYVSEEKIPAFKLGNRWKFKKTILDSWMEKQSVPGNGRGRRKSKAMRAGAGL